MRRHGARRRGRCVTCRALGAMPPPELDEGLRRAELGSSLPAGVDPAAPCCGGWLFARQRKSTWWPFVWVSCSSRCSPSSSNWYLICLIGGYVRHAVGICGDRGGRPPGHPWSSIATLERQKLAEARPTSNVARAGLRRGAGAARQGVCRAASGWWISTTPPSTTAPLRHLPVLTTAAGAPRARAPSRVSATPAAPSANRPRLGWPSCAVMCGESLAKPIEFGR